ncbi:hypothetical protein K502DRAFT_344611, partial [Neoconidiobolus thromboides FSU 785]
MKQINQSIMSTIINKFETFLLIPIKKLEYNKLQNIIKQCESIKWNKEGRDLWKYKLNLDNEIIIDSITSHQFYQFLPKEMYVVIILSLLITSYFPKIGLLMLILLLSIIMYYYQFYQYYTQFLYHWNQFINIYFQLDLQIKKALNWFIQLELLNNNINNINNGENKDKDKLQNENSIRLYNILIEIEKELIDNIKEIENHNITTTSNNDIKSFEEEDYFEIENKLQENNNKELNPSKEKMNYKIKKQVENCWDKRNELINLMLSKYIAMLSIINFKNLIQFQLFITQLACLAHHGNGHYIQIVSILEFKVNTNWYVSKEKDNNKQLKRNNNIQEKDINNELVRDFNRIEFELKTIQCLFYQFTNNLNQKSSYDQCLNSYDQFTLEIEHLKLSTEQLKNKLIKLNRDDKKNKENENKDKEKENELTINQSDKIINEIEKEECEINKQEIERIEELIKLKEDVFEMDSILEADNENQIKTPLKYNPVKKNNKKDKNTNEKKVSILDYKLELKNAIKKHSESRNKTIV